jgi:hypothetical protein
MRSPLLLALPFLVAVGPVIAAPPPAAPVVKKPAAPAAVAPAATAAATATELIAQAQKLYDSLEYDKVAPLAAQAIAHPGVTLEEKLVAYQLQGSALAIIGDPTVAEGSFSLLLSMRPDFVLPEDTPPKIKSVFAGVKATVDANRKATAAAQRKELAATIEFGGAPPASAAGGRPVRFELGVVDPRGVVKTVRVQYRKRGEAEYLSLPLARDPKNGQWTGAVPGEWSASDAGFAMEVVVVAADAEGPLKQLGDPTPVAIDVSPGQVDRTQRPVPVWVFGTAAGVTGVLALASGGIAGATAVVNADYHRKLDESSPENPAVGSDIVAQAALGGSLNTAQIVGWSAAGVGVIVTGVLALFTNWDGTEPTEEDTVAAPAPAVAPAAVAPAAVAPAAVAPAR